MNRRCECWTLPVVFLFATIADRPLHAAGPLQIVTDAFPAASLGVSYSQQLVTTGGTCPATGAATSTIDSGTLPPGLSIVSPASAESWTLQGVPTAAGDYQFALHIRWTHRATLPPFDQNCTDEAVKSFTMTVIGPTLAVDRTQISTTYHVAHFPPAPELVRVTSGSSTASSFTTQVTTNSGNWLSVTPTTSTTPATLNIAFAPSGLQPGVYTGTVSLSSGGSTPINIGVTLTVVVDSTTVLKAAPTALNFSATTGGAAPPSQTLAITVTGDSVLFQTDVSVSTPAGGKWLSVSPAGSATPATLNVTVDPKGLNPGTYTGTIALHLAFVSTIAQSIPVTFTVQAPAVLPTITPNGVVSAASLSGAITPGGWVSIFGTNLSATTREWRDADFVGGKLPTSIDGVSVTIDGKAAAVSYVSPIQLNVLAPDNANTGLVLVQVKAPAGTADSVLVLQQTAAPAFFQFRAPAATYVAGTHADGSYLAGAALVQQGIPGSPAKPGETVVIYGTGFGATLPSISATALVPTPLPLANPQDLRIRVGGVDAAITFAGLISPGLYQFNFVVPEVPDGDRAVVAELRGLLTRSDLMLTVQR